MPSKNIPARRRAQAIEILDAVAMNHDLLPYQARACLGASDVAWELAGETVNAIQDVLGIAYYMDDVGAYRARAAEAAGLLRDGWSPGERVRVHIVEDLNGPMTEEESADVCGPRRRRADTRVPVEDVLLPPRVYAPDDAAGMMEVADLATETGTWGATKSEVPLGRRGHASWCMSIDGSTGACDCDGDSEDEIIEDEFKSKLVGHEGVLLVDDPHAPSDPVAAEALWASLGARTSPGLPVTAAAKTWQTRVLTTVGDQIFLEGAPEDRAEAVARSLRDAFAGVTPELAASMSAEPDLGKTWGLLGQDKSLRDAFEIESSTSLAEYAAMVDEAEKLDAPLPEAPDDDLKRQRAIFENVEPCTDRGEYVERLQAAGMDRQVAKAWTFGHDMRPVGMVAAIRAEEDALVDARELSGLLDLYAPGPDEHGYGLDCPRCGLDFDPRRPDGLVQDGDDFVCVGCGGTCSVSVNDSDLEDVDVYVGHFTCSHGRDQDAPCEECDAEDAETEGATCV